MKRTSVVRTLVAAVLTVLFALPVSGPLASPAAARPPNDGQLSGSPQWIRFTIDRLIPQVVTAATNDLTLTGTITNIGDREIEDVRARLQVGDPITSEKRFRSELATPTDPGRASPPFEDISPDLQPGQRARITLKADVTALGISRPGIYPLLVNINGQPDFGGQARLAAVSMLLPVRSVPGSAGSPPQRQSDKPVRLSTLWPLMDDRPRLIGSSNGQPLFSDDELARSLAPGGRLYGLVNAIQQLPPEHSQVLGSLCFAIDPDLLETVNMMTGGYRVNRTDQASVAGAGQMIATQWLANLRTVTAGRCVIALPYADTDLVALARAGVVDLEKAALTAEPVQRLLPSAQLLPDVVWPIDGALDQRALSDVVGPANTDNTVVLADSETLGRSTAHGPLPIGGTSADRPPHALRLDSLISAALGGLPAGRAALSGSTVPNNTAVTMEPMSANLVPALAAQDGLAALIYRTQFAATTDQPSLIAPSRRWIANETEAETFLTTMAGLMTEGAAEPQDLSQLVHDAPVGQPAALNYPPQAAAAEIPPAITAQIAMDNAQLRDMFGAMTKDSATQVSAIQLTHPVQLALLRATSSAWRSAPTGQIDAAMDQADTQLRELTGRVTVVDLGPLSFASRDNRLPVTISNELPVSMTVHITLSKAPGLQISGVTDPLIPANSKRTVYIPITVLRSGRIMVDVALSTPGGTALGMPTRLEMTSTAYGTITLAVTGTAFGLLVLLSGRRVYRRIRAARHGTNRQTVRQ